MLGLAKCISRIVTAPIWNLVGLSALQEDLKLLELWKKKWKMSFNVDKCMVVSVTLKRTPI